MINAGHLPAIYDTEQINGYIVAVSVDSISHIFEQSAYARNE